MPMLPWGEPPPIGGPASSPSLSVRRTLRDNTRGKSMKLARRKFLHLAAAGAALPVVSRIARAQPNRPLAERLADYAYRLHHDDLDGATVEQVKLLVIDALGCAIAAFDEEPVRSCRAVALAAGDGVSTVIGTRRRSTPDLASFANGAAIRYDEMNDVYIAQQAGFGGAHPSDHIAACLAVAEVERANASELITAIVLGYEINCRLVDAIDISDHRWDQAILSLPAVALAAGKLMKLPPDRLAQAVNLAINDHVPMGQTRVQTLSDWKGLADAEAGRNAVFAALLARAGITGPAPIFEGRWGFFRLISKPADIDVGAFGGAGTEFRVHRVGMKPYPVLAHAQTSIPAAIAVAKEVGSLDRVAAIEIATTRRGYQQAGSEPEKWQPDTRETADHSLPYVVARAMFDGDINQRSFDPEKLRDPVILAFMRKMTVKPDPTFDKFPGAPPVRITATLSDGTHVVRQVDNMPGFSGLPMKQVDVERKFRSNVGSLWPRERTDALLQALGALDRADNLSVLLSMFAVQT
jgi:2-methylcitrate dehydratase